jgi:hypothetical protein
VGKHGKGLLLLSNQKSSYQEES